MTYRVSHANLPTKVSARAQAKRGAVPSWPCMLVVGDGARCTLLGMVLLMTPVMVGICVHGDACRSCCGGNAYQGSLCASSVAVQAKRVADTMAVGSLAMRCAHLPAFDPTRQNPRPASQSLGTSCQILGADLLACRPVVDRDLTHI